MLQLWCNSFRRDQVIPALEKSLEELNLNYVDLYLVHNPTSFQVKTIVTLYSYENLVHSTQTLNFFLSYFTMKTFNISQCIFFLFTLHHQSGGLVSDPDIVYSDTDFLETWQGMEECYGKGLAKSIGISNFNSKQIRRILEHCKVKPAVNQIESHPFLSNQKLVDFCHSNDIAVTAFSPLCQPDKLVFHYFDNFFGHSLISARRTKTPEAFKN